MIMKRMKYVAPVTQLYNVDVESMIALSTMTGSADPGIEVLSREQEWDIWSNSSK